MKIPFDHGTPAPQRNHLREHSVDLVRSAEKGWELLGNRRIYPQGRGRGYKAGRRKGQSTSPVRWGGFPLVGATLVVALPVQATEIDRGPPRDSHAMSRRSTGSGLVQSIEHVATPPRVATRGKIKSVARKGPSPLHPGGHVLLLGHILPLCFSQSVLSGGRSLGFAAAWDFHYGLLTFPIFTGFYRRQLRLIRLLVPSLRRTPVLQPL